jgi:hypothetical protein
MDSEPKSEPTRQAESKVVPPANKSIKYPEVAVIPAGQKQVVVIPKTQDELDKEETKEQVVKLDVTESDALPK